MKTHGNISPLPDNEFSSIDENSELSDSSNSPTSMKSSQPISSPCSSDSDSQIHESQMHEQSPSSATSPSLPVHPTPTLPQSSFSQLNEWYVCQNPVVTQNSDMLSLNSYGNNLAMHSQPLVQFS